MCGSVVEFACRECAGCEWPSRSLDKDTPLHLICTLWCRLKRDIWKTADRCDKGGYDSYFALAFLSSFATIPPAHSLSVSSYSVSLSTLLLLCFCSFHLFFLPPTRSIFSPGDGCPRHLCSVSQMSQKLKYPLGSQYCRE